MRKLRKRFDVDILNTVEAFTCYCSCPCRCGCVCWNNDVLDNDEYDDRTGEDLSSDSYDNKLATL